MSICYWLEESRIARDEGVENLEVYESSGCYDCPGNNLNCVNYIPHPEEPLRIEVYNTNHIERFIKMHQMEVDNG